METEQHHCVRAKTTRAGCKQTFFCALAPNENPVIIPETGNRVRNSFKRNRRFLVGRQNLKRPPIQSRQIIDFELRLFTMS
jgi:hypothetical protein